MSLPKRCVDLTEDQIDEALTSIESTRRLLEHMATIAKPNTGAAKILVAISRIATTACTWLEGMLRVEVHALDGATEIGVMTDLGGGTRELIFPRLLVAVEHDELVSAVKLAPRLVWPLNYRVRGDRMILKREAGTVAPPAFEIAEESLRRSLPPKLRNSLPPIGEGAILARVVFPKAARPVVVEDATNLDMGWDFGSYSSGINSRETKPPPPKVPSTMPTRPPPRASVKPSVKPSAKPSKLPPKPGPKRPLIRKKKT